jgi:hypothetical protein
MLGEASLEVGLWCALFTLRYETPHLLPWVAHNLAAGVDTILLYHDDISWSFEPSAADERLLTASAPGVTLISMANVTKANSSDASALLQQAGGSVQSLQLFSLQLGGQTVYMDGKLGRGGVSCLRATSARGACRAEVMGRAHSVVPIQVYNTLN